MSTRQIRIPKPDQSGRISDSNFKDFIGMVKLRLQNVTDDTGFNQLTKLVDRFINRLYKLNGTKRVRPRRKQELSQANREAHAIHRKGVSLAEAERLLQKPPVLQSRTDKVKARDTQLGVKANDLTLVETKGELRGLTKDNAAQISQAQQLSALSRGPDIASAIANDQIKADKAKTLADLGESLNYYKGELLKYGNDIGELAQRIPAHVIIHPEFRKNSNQTTVNSYIRKFGTRFNKNIVTPYQSLVNAIDRAVVSGSPTVMSRLKDRLSVEIPVILQRLQTFENDTAQLNGALEDLETGEVDRQTAKYLQQTIHVVFPDGLPGTSTTATSIASHSIPATSIASHTLPATSIYSSSRPSTSVTSEDTEDYEIPPEAIRMIQEIQAKRKTLNIEPKPKPKPKRSAVKPPIEPVPEQKISDSEDLTTDTINSQFIARQKAQLASPVPSGSTKKIRVTFGPEDESVLAPVSVKERTLARLIKNQFSPNIIKTVLFPGKSTVTREKRSQYVSEIKSIVDKEFPKSTSAFRKRLIELAHSLPTKAQPEPEPIVEPVRESSEPGPAVTLPGPAETPLEDRQTVSSEQPPLWYNRPEGEWDGEQLGLGFSPVLTGHCYPTIRKRLDGLTRRFHRIAKTF